MVLHVASAEEIETMEWSCRDACTLLVTALAELHANSTMFGGVDSTSFKMKWKRLDQRCKQLVRRFFPPL